MHCQYRVASPRQWQRGCVQHWQRLTHSLCYSPIPIHKLGHVHALDPQPPHCTAYTETDSAHCRREETQRESYRRAPRPRARLASAQPDLCAALNHICLRALDFENRYSYMVYNWEHSGPLVCAAFTRWLRGLTVESSGPTASMCAVRFMTRCLVLGCFLGYTTFELLLGCESVVCCSR